MAFFNNPGSALLDAGTSIASSLLEYQYARKLQDRQFDFQRDMSGTSYQRAVADLKKAGINPMLAYMQGGATTPSGGMVGTPKVDLTRVVSSAREAMRLKEELANVRALTYKHKEDARLAKESANLQEAHAYSARNQMEVEKKHPKAFGIVDALLRRLGMTASTALGLTGTGMLMKNLFGVGNEKSMPLKIRGRGR